MVWIEQSNDILIDTGTYRTHQYTTVGTYDIQVLRPGRVEVLVVGGGGAGGTGASFSPGGGGGGGGVVYVSDLYINIGTLSITVGDGGVGSLTIPPTNEGFSSFSNIIALGGGAGGSVGISNATTSGYDGASGGGGGRTGAPGNSVKTIGLGNNGGAGSNAGGAGGGGATQIGVTSIGTSGVAGGQGYTSSISGTTTVYGSGGGGGRRSGVGGTGGTNAGNGGGFGGNSLGGDNGVANRGGGGGGGQATGTTGAAQNQGGNGGSGIVIMRYPTTDYLHGSNVFFSQIKDTFGESNTPIWIGRLYNDDPTSVTSGIPDIPSSNSVISVDSFRLKTKNVIVADYDVRQATSYSNNLPTTFNDLSRNNYNLVFNQTPTYSSSPFFITLTSNNYASSTTLPINLQSGYSIETLFRFSTNTNNNFKIFSYTASNNSNGIQLQVDSTNKAYLSNSQSGIFRNETTLVANTWYHAVFTSSNTSYVNGASNATTGTTNVLSTGQRTLTIGDIGGQRSMAGNVAFLKLYNYAKDSNEVAVSYESAKILYPAYNIT
jgi:hypothetical protein